ncbi:Oidioi.mRNA.OKI2018_I69.chr2.g5309.t1.cds [Oikopleura dioica]|uniref:Oidioi.mRNA.OKI2018_I69.chr2.g5309.t1.cds n=1 Tax=Oikopleura dioica TaxID=34765 RepID=A0ABN7T6L7_OIKDI|nr:Oidioi.mRNA.OKI2018_I69.chr2.g5309.t1.cds [Oikopleura dioica]
MGETKEKAPVYHDLSDDEYLYCLKLNNVQIKYQYNTTSKEKRIIMSTAKVKPFSKTLDNTWGGKTKDLVNKDAIAVFKDFMVEKQLLSKSPEEIWQEYELICSKEFIAFFRKPGRLYHERMNSCQKVYTYLDGQYFAGEGQTKIEAVRACARNVYYRWRESYCLDVEELKVFFDRGPTDPDAMKMAYIATPKDLAKVKKYVELANYLLIDQEGDQLGPNGKITVIQINTYESPNCFLLDILETGDQELREKDGWLRQMLEDPKKIKFFWGGCSDTANLYASFGIKIASYVDLQAVEFHYRHKLAHLTDGFVEPGDKGHPLGLESAYKFFTEADLLKYKASKGKHKTDHHIWARRPLPESLLRYASFDVAAMRPLLHLFFNNLELWKWGKIEAAISISTLSAYPRHRTCFACLQSIKVDEFAKNQQKSLGICLECSQNRNTDEFFYELENVEKWPVVAKEFHLPESLTGHENWVLKFPQKERIENGFEK